MTKGKQVFAWNDGDIVRTSATYSHQGSVKHWVKVEGKSVSFDNFSTFENKQITKKQAERLIVKLTGENITII